MPQPPSAPSRLRGRTTPPPSPPSPLEGATPAPSMAPSTRFSTPSAPAPPDPTLGIDLAVADPRAGARSRPPARPEDDLPPPRRRSKRPRKPLEVVPEMLGIFDPEGDLAPEFKKWENDPLLSLDPESLVPNWYPKEDDQDQLLDPKERRDNFQEELQEALRQASPSPSASSDTAPTTPPTSPPRRLLQSLLQLRSEVPEGSDPTLVSS